MKRRIIKRVGANNWSLGWVLVVLAAGLLSGCQANVSGAGVAQAADPTLSALLQPTATATATPQVTASATATLLPPTPTASATPPPLPSATPSVADLCRIHGEGDLSLLITVNRDIALPRSYEPNDLAEVPIEPQNRYFMTQVIRLRLPVHAALLAMVTEMNNSGLRPIVMSGYRSFSEQTLAFQKWQAQYPDRVDNLSARPGHSEHQLGTVVDFWNFGNMYEQFSVRFANSPEGQWMQENAANYGFTMSYPDGVTEITGYEYEPWHYRYVGPALALDLQHYQLTLTEFLAECAFDAPANSH